VTEKKQSTVFAFIIITILFFLWGGITSINDVLIDNYKTLHELNELQSMYILLAFFGAYGIGSLAYYLYSQKYGDPINKLGYKKGILMGLIISGIGCLSLYPITATGNYYACLSSFFVIGLGLTLLQISCNPYIAILGSDESSSSRLNLSQGFNSLGTTVGPLIAGYLILSYASKSAAIQDLYLYCGILFFLFAILLIGIKLPDYKSETSVKLSGSAFQFSHLKAGMLAIFFYVGAEVMIGGKIMAYIKLPEIGNLSQSDAISYLGIYWGGAMIGRLAISVISSHKFNLTKKVIYGLLTVVITYLSIVLFISIKEIISAADAGVETNGIFSIFKETMYEIRHISWFIILQFILMLIFRKSSGKLLGIFAGLIILALLIAFFAEGKLALWCILGIGLFNSIMWSNIFTLSISGLKEYTSQGSSLLIIMIIGGAILPLGMGWLSDIFGSIKIGFLFPIISYLYILYFGLYGSRTKH
jgi:FHS family L-fucose permease-like MFS transporter